MDWSDQDIILGLTGIFQKNEATLSLKTAININIQRDKKLINYKYTEIKSLFGANFLAVLPHF